MPDKQQTGNVTADSFDGKDISQDPSVFCMQAVTEFSADDNDNKQNIRLMLYDGSIQSHWYWGKLAFDLDGMKLAKKRVPIMLDHWEGIGFSTGASFDGKLILEGQFLPNDEKAQQVRQNAIDGFPYEASLRFDISRSVRVDVPEGQSEKVNGKTMTGPGVIFRKVVIDEGSITTFGALKGCKTQVFKQDTSLQNKETLMDLAQFQKEHADLHVQICEENQQRGLETARTQFQELVEAVGDNPALVVKCFSEGKSVTEALKLHNEELQQQNAELSQKLKNKPTEPKTPSTNKQETTVDPAVTEFSDETTDTPETNATPTTEEQQRAQFQKDTKLQEEYGGDENAYIAFCQANGKGLVKMRTA